MCNTILIKRGWSNLIRMKGGGRSIVAIMLIGSLELYQYSEGEVHAISKAIYQVS